MRITTGMIASQYGRNLNASLGQLNYYNNRATNFRKFNSVSEDPVASAKAYSLRRSYSQNEDYLNNLADTENLFQTAHSTKLNINSILEEIVSSDILQAVNGTMQKEDRTIVATKISRLQEALLTNANAKYGEKYMFNGGDYTSQPFSIDKSGNLLYRGINVDTGLHIGNADVGASATLDGATIDFGTSNTDLLNGYQIEFSADAVGTNSVDKTARKIIIGSGGAAMTAADLQTQLQALPTADLPGGFDPTKITVTGDAATGVGTAKLRDGEKATNIPATTYLGGANIDFGKRNGDLLNGYSLKVTEGAAGSSVDNDQKVINISLPAGATKLDLENALKGVAGLPAGVDTSAFSISGNKSATISFGSSEITGGEPSIPKGTAFDLDLLAKETRYVDLGLGLSFNSNDKLDAQSVFDISMPGIAMLGYGVDSDGQPKNVYSQLTQIVNLLKSDDFSMEKMTPLIGKIGDQKNNLLYNMTDTDSKTTFINFTKERLEDSKINLTTKMKQVETVEPSEAIMDFKMQEYAYMAALQMGSKIIQPTFLDFMR